MKKFIIISLFLVAAFAGCSQNTKNSSSGNNTSSSVTLHSSAMGNASKYSGTTSSLDAALSYSCANGAVSGNTTLSAGTLSLESAASSCTFTFNSLTYNGSTDACTTTTTVSSANPANITPVLFSCGSYILKIITSGIFDSSASPNLYAFLLSAPEITSTSAQTNMTLPIVGAGDNYTCAMVASTPTADPEIYCWGSNYFGFVQSIAPTNMAPLGFTPQKVLSVGEDITCTIDTSKNLWCLGSWTAAGQTTSNNAFIQVGGFTNVEKIATGIQSVCALTSASNTTLYCLGYLDFFSSPASGGYQSSPVAMPAFSAAVSQFAISNDPAFGIYGAVCAVVGSDNHVECAGNNIYGQLGLGVSSDTTLHNPASVVLADSTTLTNVIQLSGRNGTFCARTSAENLYCWGNVNNTPYQWYVSNAFQGAGAPTSGSYAASLGSTIFIREPNFFGFMSSGSWSASGWAGGDYLFANTPMSASDYSSTFTTTPYISTFSHATLIPLSLRSISVGAQTICGSSTTGIYCYGADLTIPPSNINSQGVYNWTQQDSTESLWGGAGLIYMTNGAYPSLWSQYAYGDMGTLSLSVSISPSGWNGTTSYTSSASTGGGFFDLSQTILDVSVGAGNWGCSLLTWASGWQYVAPGHACVATEDGAVSCFGENDCGQVGNNIPLFSGTPIFVTTPTAVLYPSALDGTTYSGGVGY